MFYQGALQDGISAAVAQQKPVLCFVTDDEDESQKWENEYLQDETLNDLIKNRAIALRLTAGSDEAGYLAQIFPLPQTPTIVIMKNGELKEYIIAGVSKDEMIRRIQKAFSAPTEVLSGATDSAPVTAPSQHAEAANPPASPEAPAETSEHVRRILAQRAARSVAQRTEADRKAKEERAKAEEKAKAEAEAGADAHAAQAHSQAELVKKKRQQESEERQRILKRIEDDRAERRLQAQQREKARAESKSVGDEASTLVNASETKVPSSTKVGAMTSIQVRLLDGSNLRSRFKNPSTVRDVRKWVDENRTDEKQPYTFKHLLTPLPSRNIDATEEDKTLSDLGLAPSSTLILIPVQRFASAYQDGPGNPISQLIALIMGFFTWLLSLVGLGGRAQQPAASDNASSSQGPAQDRSRVHGFGSQADRRRDQQLYNGNSLNFEPRPDDEDDKQ